MPKRLRRGGARLLPGSSSGKGEWVIRTTMLVRDCHKDSFPTFPTQNQGVVMETSRCSVCPRLDPSIPVRLARPLSCPCHFPPEDIRAV